jgi:hypothetical protein
MTRKNPCKNAATPGQPAPRFSKYSHSIADFNAERLLTIFKFPSSDQNPSIVFPSRFKIHPALLVTLVCLSALCSSAAFGDRPKTDLRPIPTAVEIPFEVADLIRRYEAIREFIGDEMYGPGGPIVLKVAFEALSDKHWAGEGLLVGLEDVWSHALQEGLILFNNPEARWGKTTAEETSDMIGQTTIGPWQMTLRNIRATYGPPYGIDSNWTDAQIYIYCRDHPDVQAKMIIDYIQRSYEVFGRRSPYAMQRYFWLEPFVKGELGQADDWTKSVVAKPPPGGTWHDLTPAMKADTGFYAKQVLLGTSYTNSGLLFWLAVTGDDAGLRNVLRTWRDEQKLDVISSLNDAKTDVEKSTGTLTMEGVTYRRTTQPGNFAITPDDVIYYEEFPTIRARVIKAIQHVNDN